MNTNGSSILDHLETLVEQSLVVFDPGMDGPRYGMLEPVRQYAREKLERSGEATDTRHAHTGLFLTLAERAASELWGPGQGEWLERLELENYNLHAAITRALEADEAETAARLCWALCLFWWVRGHHREGRRLAEAALEHDLPAALHARASLAAATMSYTLADYPAAGAYWEQTLRSSQQANDPLTQAYSLAGTGLVELVRPDYAEAASRMERALEFFEVSEDDSIASLTRTWLGTTLMARGELEGGRKELHARSRFGKTQAGPAMHLRGPLQPLAAGADPR